MAPADPDAGKAGAFLPLWLLLTFIWFAANSSLAIEALVTGALIAAILAFIFARTFAVWSGVRLAPQRLIGFVRYFGVFLVELVRANLNMLRYVYARRIEINPGIVEVKTRLETPVGRLALANSIALTPGSLVVDIDGDSLFIHWLDVKTTDTDEATRLIAGPFEAPLEQTFG